MKFSVASTLASLLLFVLTGSLHAATYYISLTGNDTSSGTSPDQAWASIQKVNSSDFVPGDSILFEGGKLFSGMLDLDADQTGTETSPLVITSYGTGKAIISSGNTWGLYVYNAAGIHISKLIFKGSGLGSNTTSGIEFYLDQPDTRLSTIAIDQVEVSGYRNTGIIIGSWSGGSGYDGVSITNSEVHDCGEGGINTYAEATLGHKDFYLGYNTVYDISGLADITDHHTGSGIALGGIDGALVEYCEVYNTGRLSAYENAGPAGIWGYRCNNLVMQFNESHHNKTSSSKDGGGFDIDGGCTNCTLQYNYSHDNDGPGFLLSQYQGAPLMKNVTIRYNISENDVRKNNYGAIHVWSSGSNGGIDNALIYNNTIYLTPSETGIPKAVYLQSGGVTNLRLRNNIFYTSGGVELIYVDSQTDVRFEWNTYWSSGDRFKIRWGKKNYSSLEDWRLASGQEILEGEAIGLEVDPQLEKPGQGGTIGAPAMLYTLDSYTLKASSELIGKALDQQQKWGINIGSRDFWGNPLPQGQGLSIGAHQFSSGSRVCLYGGIISLSFAEGAVAGGTYSGAGVLEGGQFDPAVAGVGQHQLAYTYVDEGGVQKQLQHIVTVIDTKTTTWNGHQTKNRDWFWGQNWTSCVPTAQTDVIIPAPADPNTGVGAYPSITADGYAQVNTIRAGDTLRIMGNGMLEVNGLVEDTKYIAADAGALIFKSEQEQPIPAGRYGKLILEGAMKKVLRGTVSIREALVLGTGNLHLGEHNLRLDGGGSIENASANSYLVTTGAGGLEIAGVGEGNAVVFPLGTAESYTPVTLANSGVTDDFLVRVAPGVFQQGTTGTALTEGWVNRTWHITEKVSGGSEVLLSLQWGEEDQQQLFDPAKAYISQYLADGWSSPSEAAEASEMLEAGQHRIRLNPVTEFSAFAIRNRQELLATEDASLNTHVLPLENPFISSIRLQVEVPTASSLQLSFLDMMGQVLQRNEYALGSGKQVISLPLRKQYPAGLYLLKVQIGAEVQLLKLLKQ